MVPCHANWFVQHTETTMFELTSLNTLFGGTVSAHGVVKLLVYGVGKDGLKLRLLLTNEECRPWSFFAEAFWWR